MRVNRALDAARRKRQKEIDEYSERGRQIEQIQTALADGTLFAHWSDGGLKVDLLDESRFRSNGKVRKGRETLNEIISARFERPMSLSKLFELLDIKAVVYSDQIEVRGAFTDQDGFGPPNGDRTEWPLNWCPSPGGGNIRRDGRTEAGDVGG